MRAVPQASDASLAVLDFKFSNEGHCPLDALEEGARPHSPPDAECAKAISEIENPILKLDAADVLAHIHGVKTLLRQHTLALPDSTQRGIGPETASEHKTVTALPRSFNGEFLRTAVAA